MSDHNWLMIRLSHFQSNQGKRFDGELHIVHYNTKYRRVSIIIEFRYYRYYCRRLAKVCKAEQNLNYSFLAGICVRQARWACCVGRFSAGKICYILLMFDILQDEMRC